MGGVSNQRSFPINLGNDKMIVDVAALKFLKQIYLSEISICKFFQRKFYTIFVGVKF